MQWSMVSRTIKIDSDARFLFKCILSNYSDVDVLINKFKKFNKIVLNDVELSTLHSILVDYLDNCSKDESDFIMGFLDNIS